ncbi:hypothetical protein N7G274_003848 [Stereocaulon virgatum]|uniref:C2H2-type domain-containing protein n=1 Tax=Stereocaulon virgatum TaxID=373712 RepID=A0ABR4ADH9_9LECA
MKFAGHNNADTFFGSYAPDLSTVDGMASYWNKKRRTVHLEGFHGLSLHHHPQLLQSLPAKVEADLDNCSEFISVNQEIEMLGEKLRGIKTEDEAQLVRARREGLYWRKRQLVSEELSKWLQIQPRKAASDTEAEAPLVASLPSFFNRIRRLDPPRDRLASSLFLSVSLRSDQGRSALQDMITLCEENPPSTLQTGGSIFTAVVTDGPKWFTHCQNHINGLETFPVQCDPLVFRRTLATAGQCLFCLFNSKLSPTRRFHQFLLKQSWKEYLQEHFWQLEGACTRSTESGERKAFSCPDPRCALSFDSIQDFQCHCQDVHCIERIKLDPIKRRRRTYRSSPNAKATPDAAVKLKYHRGLLSDKISVNRVDKSIDAPKLEPMEGVAPMEPLSKDDRDNEGLNHSLPSIETILNRDEQILSVSTFSETTLSTTDEASDEVVLDNFTPISSVPSDLSLSIDPKLLEESDS